MNPSVYRMKKSPRRLPVNRRRYFDGGVVKIPEFDKTQEPIAVDRSTNCFVTPPDVAARMVEYLGGCGDILTLEPSAGTGNLVQALFDAGQSHYELTCIEQNTSLCTALNQRFSREGIKITGFRQCFLEYAERARGKIRFPHIIMNPPFARGAAKRHVEAALSLMGRGGHDESVLIALVPITYDHPAAETLEELEPGTFQNTQARTKIIRITS